MKKLMSLLLALAMILSLTACGGGKETPPASQDKPATEEAKPEETTDPPVNLTVVSAGNTKDNAISKGYDKFAELVEEYSNGNITADVYYGSEMGSLSACVDGVFQGTIDVCSCGPSYISGYVPAVQVFELPFLFNNAEEARATLDGEPGQYISSLFEGSGALLFTYFESGMRQLMNNRNPIVKPEDMAGLKIRIVPSKTQNATWEAFGAIPMAVDMTETFTALQNGTVDANENGMTTLASYKMWEVQDYLSVTNHSYTPITVMFNENSWASLTENQQKIVRQAFEDARDWQRELTDELTEDCYKQMEENGVEIEWEPDTEAFKALIDPAVYDIFNEIVGSSDVLDMTQSFVASLR